MILELIERYVREHKPYKGGAWCYEDGLLYRGLELLYKTTGERKWLTRLIELVDAQIEADGSLTNYDTCQFNMDNVQGGRALLFLFEETGEQRYMDLAAGLMRQLAHQPRTKSGVYWHKLRYPWQVWLDGLYMGPPFQIRYAQLTDQPALLADSIAQVSTALDMAYDPNTGLYAHAVDEARLQSWANPETGHTAAHWARALGWLAMALVDIAEIVDEAEFEPLRARTVTLLDDIDRLRCESGLWLQVIDQPDLEGNYEESSASAMFVYALVKGQSLGIWKGNADGYADAFFSAAIGPRAQGGHEMKQMVHVAGLGMYEGRFRDGTAAYYVSEDVTCDDIKGISPMIGVYALTLAESGT